MSSVLASMFRRIILLALLGAVGGAAFKMLRNRHDTAAPAAPEWPPFEPANEPTMVPATEPATVPATAPATVPATEPTNAAAPGRVDDSAPYVDSSGGSTAPDGFPVKVKTSSGIFHVPGGRFYDRTVADRFYPSTAGAEADGYRASKT